MKPLPALLASLAILPLNVQASDVGRADQSAQKQIAIDLKSCAKPAWPKESLRNEQTGKVTLEFLIDLDGKVLESKVLQSSGFPLLDMAAQDGLAKCQFTPPPSVGRTQPTRTKMQYVWVLNGKKQSDAELQAEWQRILASAEQGNAADQYRAAGGYLLGRGGIEKDSGNAMRWLHAAAEQSHTQAMEALAYEYLRGVYMARDPEQAFALLEKAAAQNSATAQYRLAVMLLGQEGVPRDEQRSKDWLEKAAAGGLAPAKGALGALLLRQGDEHAADALRLLQEAVDAHDRPSQFVMAGFYEKGEHVPQDRSKALALYERAAAAGYPKAREAMLRIKAQEQ